MAQVFRELGHEAPDVDDAALLKAFFIGCQRVRREYSDLVLAYHDRSDGGLFATVVEMAFAGRVGLEVSLDEDPVAALFAEELGAVVQVRASHVPLLGSVFEQAGLPRACIRVIGHVARSRQDQRIIFTAADAQPIFTSTRAELQKIWAETSYHMQAMRDDPKCADEEYARISDPNEVGLRYNLPFDPSIPSPGLEKLLGLGDRPRVAILREQGVNGHIEMAWAFHAAGFTAIDVHMTDLLAGRVSLGDFKGLACCGGFSYGDVLGAGRGWAMSFLRHKSLRSSFVHFLSERKDTFVLGVCNGAQLLSALRDLIPGDEVAHWPRFKPNKSGRFEGRASMVEVVDTEATRSSVFLRSLAGATLPVPVAHGEGRAAFDDPADLSVCEVAVRYVDNGGVPASKYPANPNGGPGGVTGVMALKGRVLAMMPHPERAVLKDANSFLPYEARGGKRWNGRSTWMRMFEDARLWVG